MNAWGCDRCQVTYPVQPVSPPLPAQATMRAPGSPRSKKKILLVAGIGVAALAVVLILVLVMGGGGGGKKDPKDLFQSAFDAAQKGDVDALMALDVSSKAGSASECKPSKGGHSDDDDDLSPEAMKKEARKRFAKQVDDWKDVTVTVSSVEEHGDPRVMKPGKDDEGSRCTLKTEITTQMFDVAVKVKSKDGEGDDDLRLTAVEIDGLWYLTVLPSAPGGNEGKMKKFKDAMCGCKDEACADGVEKDYKEFEKTLEQKYKGMKPEDLENDKDAVKLMKLASDYEDCKMKAMFGSAGSGG